MDITSIEYQMMLVLLGVGGTALFVIVLLAGQGGDRQPQHAVRSPRYRRYEYEPREESGPGCASVLVIAVFITLLICLTASFG